MRALRILLVLSFVACSSAPPPPPPPPPAPAAAKPAEPEPHFAEGNGDVVKVPIDGAVAVAVQLHFYTGSVDDPAGKEGLTKLTATLMAEGGTKKRTYPEMLRALYPMAATIGVNVDKEQTVFHTLMHTDHVEKVVPMLAEVVTMPRLEASDFERVKQNLVNDIEKRLRATDDENLGKALLNRMMYPGDHPYRHFVGGTVKGLKAITLEDVRAHAAKVFGRRRLLIGLGGAANDAIEAQVKGALESLPEGAPRLAKVRAAPKPSATKVLIAEKPSAQAVAISIGYPHDTRRGEEDFFPLALVQSYFGEHRQFHGVLMAEMRGIRGLNYGDYAYVENFIQEGWSRLPMTNVARRRQHFEMWIRPVAPDDAVFSIRLAMYFLDRLVRDGLTGEDVEQVTQFLDGYTRLWEMTPSRRLGYALDDHFYGTSGYLASYRAALPSMTADRVNAALRRQLVPSPVLIAIVTKDAQALKAALVSGEKTSKTYVSEKPDEVMKVDAVVHAFPLNITEENVEIVPVDSLFVD